MSRVLIVPNERLPRLGNRASGPGLRALNLAVGLKSNGHDVVVAVNALPHQAADPNFALGDPLIPDIEEVPIAFEGLPDFIRTREPHVAIFTNYINFQYVLSGNSRSNLGATKLIYDFFAPRFLELRADNTSDSINFDAERRKKTEALKHADAILLNGTKKLGYVTAWLAMSSAKLGVPIVNTPFCVPVTLDASNIGNTTAPAVVKIIVSGNRHSWTKSALELLDILPTLARNGWSLIHIGRPAFTLTNASHEAYLPWLQSGILTSYSDVDFCSFVDILKTSNLALDIFQSSLEREMAYVVRTAVAMSAGLPVIHRAGTELADLILKWKSGWLYNDEIEILSIIDWINSHPESLKERTAAARTLATTYFNPRQATLAASQLITSISDGRRRSRTHEPQGAKYSDPYGWIGQIASIEWLRRRHNLDYFGSSRASCPADLYFGIADGLQFPPPNFLLAHAFRQATNLDMRSVTEDAAKALLEQYFDVEWYCSTYNVLGDVFACATHYCSAENSAYVSPSPYFCERVYLEMNSEVNDAVANRLFINGFHHFLTHGMVQRLAISVMYDETFYVAAYPDIAGAVETGVYNSGFEHFLKHGRAENRRSTPLFDPDYYREQYIDFPKDWGATELRRHFVQFGLKEGRFGSPFHRELLSSPLRPPPLGAYFARAGAALRQLDTSSRSQSDLALRFENHIQSVQTAFNDALNTNVVWLRKLIAYKF